MTHCGSQVVTLIKGCPWSEAETLTIGEPLSNTRNGFSDVTLVTRVAERGIHNSPTQLRTRSWTAVVYDGWLTEDGFLTKILTLIALNADFNCYA